MSGEEGMADAVVRVCCSACLDRFGVNTCIGEMVLYPKTWEAAATWSWVPGVRHRFADDSRRRMRRTDRDVVSGGQEVRCHRCGATIRFRVARLAARAEQAATGTPTRRGTITI